MPKGIPNKKVEVAPTITPAPSVSAGPEVKTESVSDGEIKVRGVFGRMVHPKTSQVFDQLEPVQIKKDAWVQCQLDAKKLVEC